MKSESEAAKGEKEMNKETGGPSQHRSRPTAPALFSFFFFLLSSAWDARIRLLISGSSQVASFRWMPQLNGAPL